MSGNSRRRKEKMWFFRKNDKKKTDSPESQMETAAGFMKKGDDHTRRHEFAEAEKCYLQCLSILEPLSKQYESTQLLRELSRTYSMLNVLGRAVTDEKKRSEAVVWLKKSLEIDEKLAEQAGTAQAYDDLACSYSGLGDSALDITYCEKALAIWQDLHRRYPNERLYEKRIEDEQYNIGKLKEYLSRRK